jgi:large subunit ribosomal protein L7Ae
MPPKPKAKATASAPKSVKAAPAKKVVTKKVDPKKTGEKAKTGSKTKDVKPGAKKFSKHPDKKAAATTKSIATKGKKGKPVKEVKKNKANALKHKHPNLFIPRPKNFGIGQDLPPVRNLTRFVKWPAYIRRQRQKAILMRRLKVPPAINQFRMCLDRVTKKALFRLIGKYRPETRTIRKQRLKKLAEAKAKDRNAPPPAKAPVVVTGLQRVTRAIETKRAKFVIIANDVHPLDLIVWMPTLCKKLEVPFCIVKNTAALGRLVNRKRVTCMAIVDIRTKDKAHLERVMQAAHLKFGDKFDDFRKKWGGLVLGKKHDLKMKKREDAIATAAGRIVAKKKK